ncbi:MAG: hypothetical protein AAGN46_14930 [Acidobacteriota bacterium]
MRQIAYLSMDSLDDFVGYDHLTLEPLSTRGISVETVSWRAKDVDWADFEAVVVRSPWDYQDAPAEFLRTLESINAVTRLENPLAVLRWNLDKKYLREVEERGVPIVPTAWGDAAEPVVDVVARLEASLDTVADELIVKPRVSANADDTFRLARSAVHAPAHDIQQTLAATFAERPFMVQPFLPSVLARGELSLFYFGGEQLEFSHAVCKLPAAGDFRVQEEHGGSLRAVDPSPAARAAAACALDAVPDSLLYARVDLIQDEDGAERLIELELIEPSLYFAFDPASPARFADAVVRRLAPG